MMVAMADERLRQPYDHREWEATLYRRWEESGFFNPDKLPGERAQPFTLIMPPTNANGNLHAGHALVMTIEDIMVRYQRMRGRRALWLPGNDHAGFETQVVYEKKLEKEGRSRFDMPPQKLHESIMEFTQGNRANINNQVRLLGASCDWSREKFTLDEDVVRTVYRTFKKLSDDKLLYRGKRIVSWCPKHQTSFSDLEIKDEERTDSFYYLKYGPFTIGTARPETKFGDKYVVMHPSDERYLEYKHGQTIELEWINGPVRATIIKDAVVEKDFGTGVMTITPWHDAIDFEIAERHGLDKEQIIDWSGKLLPIAGEFASMHIKKARPLIVEKLKQKGLLERVEEGYKHTVRTCYKCDTPIEPQIKPQWFIRMQPLAARAIEAIERGEVVFIPDYYKKIVLHWLESIIDWNISRQIVWGIPIPAVLCERCEDGCVDLEGNVGVCPRCGGAVRKDPDTFDTWFSSGQWPFAALGYPDSSDFKTFFPTDVLETAGEIIFFWVARMIMLSLYVTGEVPFRTVYLHGLVLDARGKKMSKSKGNVIDPLTITEKYGTDALRMGLIVGNTPGTSLALSEEKIRGYKHFSNKLWNIARFVVERAEGTIQDTKYKMQDTNESDKKLLSELDELSREATDDLEHYRLHVAAEKLYHYVWHTFADKIIEEAKPRLRGEDADDARAAACLLDSLLRRVLILLHPFMPFLTEAIWQLIERKPGEPELLLVAPWPM